MRKHLELQAGRRARCSPTSTRCTTRSGSPSSTRTSRRSTEAIVDAAAAAGVKTLELRYSPIIHTYAGLTPRQSIRAVLSGMNHAAGKHPGMKLGLVVIAMRQHGPHIAKILARQAIAEAQHLHARVGVVGFDIAGPERGNPPRLFRSAYEIARLGRLGLTAHAGRGRARRVRLAGGGQAGRRRASATAAPPPRTRSCCGGWRATGSLVECCLSQQLPHRRREARRAPPDPHIPRGRRAGGASAATTPRSRAPTRCARACWPRSRSASTPWSRSTGAAGALLHPARDGAPGRPESRPA